MLRGKRYLNYIQMSILSQYKVIKLPSHTFIVLPNVYCVIFCQLHFFLNWYSGGWRPIGSTRHCDTNRPIMPVPSDYDDGESGGMIGRGNRNTRRKPAPMPLCPPQTPHAALTRTRAAAVGSRRLTAWATARPVIYTCFNFPIYYSGHNREHKKI
jgi:hypothetical protein